jgi:predicted O-methyltransferase YrrM
VIPERVATVLRRLEEQDARDRIDGSPQVLRLRQIPREVGEFLHTLVLAANAQTIVEIGTSAGYSTLWLALATQQTGGRVITFEIDSAKVGLARRSFADAGLADAIDLKHVDARDGIGDVDTGSVDLTFLDAEKDVYEPLLEPIVQALRPGGLLVADNLTSHAEELAAFRELALGHPELTGLVVPIGRGELVAVKRRMDEP